jgi:hypothetical protein
MRWVAVVVPLVGTLVAAGVPLVRYALMERHEQTAIAVLQRVQEAQAAFQRRAGGYASRIESLTIACEGGEPLLRDDGLAALAGAGYSFTLRPADRARALVRDCHGHDIVSDYYVAAAPSSPAVAARQAFAGRADQPLHFFVDGIAPLERDIERGLATPLALRESFRIP